KRTADTP
ncbi:DNA gyrase/topoisomerase IV, subunit A family protein, partial [Chlamydia psittaci 06-1683]